MTLFVLVLVKMFHVVIFNPIESIFISDEFVLLFVETLIKLIESIFILNYLIIKLAKSLFKYIKFIIDNHTLIL